MSTASPISAEANIAPAIRALLRRCLEKDRQKRIADISTVVGRALQSGPRANTEAIVSLTSLPANARLPLSTGERLERALPNNPAATEFAERDAYFSWSATFAIPAFAHASSAGCPPFAPLSPTPPIASLPTMIGTPPPSGMT